MYNLAYGNHLPYPSPQLHQLDLTDSAKLASYTTYYYPSTTVAMSPAAFQHRVTDFMAILRRCREDCDAIVAFRHISHEHGNLDNLRAALNTSSSSVWFEFNSLRNLLGSRMDLGDETARHAMSSHIRDLEASVQTRLRNIALRVIVGPAGFKDLLKKVERIGEKVKTTLIDLGVRLNRGARSPPLPLPAPVRIVRSPTPVAPARPARKPSTKPKKVAFADDDNLRHHLKNSWEEIMVGNAILYVNCYDRTKTSWTRPNGFIKPLARRPAPTPVWAPVVPQMPLPRRTPPIQFRIL